MDEEYDERAGFPRDNVRTRHGDPDHWRDRLADFATLEEDWDSYGSKPISPVAIRRATDLIVRVRAPATITDVFPIGDGGILVEYETETKEVGVEIGDGNLFEVHIDRFPNSGEHPKDRFIAFDTTSEDVVVAAIRLVLES